MTITNTHLIESKSSRLDMPERKSSQLVESLLEVVKKTLESGENVLISGFGKCYEGEEGAK